MGQTYEPNKRNEPIFGRPLGQKGGEDTKGIQPQIAYGLMGIDSRAVELK
jgi:hypothetical protein